MLKLSLKKKPPQTAAPTVCMAHRNNMGDVSSNDKSPFVRKDVFAQYAQRMDERCGNHEDMISAVGKKIDKLNQLFIGLLIFLLAWELASNQPSQNHTAPKPTAKGSLSVLTKRTTNVYEKRIYIQRGGRDLLTNNTNSNTKIFNFDSMPRSFCCTHPKQPRTCAEFAGQSCPNRTFPVSLCRRFP